MHGLPVFLFFFFWRTINVKAHARTWALQFVANDPDFFLRCLIFEYLFFRVMKTDLFQPNPSVNVTVQINSNNIVTAQHTLLI